MAENTENKTTKGSTTTSKAVEGEGVTTQTSNTAVTSVGGLAVPAPLDAPAGQPQAGNLGAPDTAGVQNANAGLAETRAGYPLKVTVDNHTHAGTPVKKHSTIMLDLAEYRWALENRVGIPGNKDDVGYDVTDTGEVIKPENEKDLADLEAEAIKAAETPAENTAA